MRTLLPESSSLPFHRAQAIRLGRPAFDRSRLPPTRSFYQAELGELGPPNGKGWAPAKNGCPFCPSKSRTCFRVNLHSGAFRCFRCDVRGCDVIAFTRVRYGLGFVAAAKELGAWRGSLTRDDQVRIARARRQREQELAQQEARREAERQQRIQARDELHASNRLLAQVSEDLHNNSDNDSLWDCLQLAWECRELDEREYMEVAGLGAHGEF